MRSVATPDGRTLAVREAGLSYGVPVIAMHGSPGSGVLYKAHIRDANERGIRLISYDRPGFGRSSRLKGRNVADAAIDVNAICDGLGLDRVCIWAMSSGGPHALAAAALLPDRVAAVAVLASVAPFDADGLDFTAGMGEQNVKDFEAVLRNEASHLETMDRERSGLLAAKPEDLLGAWSTLLGPADREAATSELAEFLLEHLQAGLEHGYDGWVDDEFVVVWPWGFELSSIRVPVLVWHGEEDRFVPPSHGRWLGEHIPGAELRITADDGHLTLLAGRIPVVHAWLLERFGTLNP